MTQNNHHGLDVDAQLIMRWQWQPMPPVKLDMPLPQQYFYSDSTLLSVQFDAIKSAGLVSAYRFSFPQLFAQTPNLVLYKLLQIFNTPLIALSRREAGRARFAYWHGEAPLDGEIQDGA